MTVLCDSIADRVFSTFPSGQYCLPALMRIVEIIESDEVPTACIECTARPRMFINPSFVANHAQTPEKLLMLVMHELHHVVLGHTRLYRRIELIDNLVFDAVINAMLCRMFPDAEYTALFRDYYHDDRFPECFLRPPTAWDPQRSSADSFAMPAALRSEGFEELAALYRALYSGNGAGYEELKDAFARRAAQGPIGKVSLLGDHREEGNGSSSDGLLEHRAPVLVDELRRITEQWPRPPHPIIGCSPHEMLEKSVTLVPKSNRSRLNEILHKLGGSHRNGRITKRADVTATVTSVVPRSDRRSMTVQALGGRTMLYRSETHLRRVVHNGPRVHVYLDVSGSMTNLIGPLYAAVIASRAFVHPIIHLFSTKIADVTLDQLRRGVCVSTGGTSIECVADHMRLHKVRRALIITDGYVGQPGAAGAAVLQNAVVGVAISPGNSTRSDLNLFADHWINLKEIKP